MRKKAWRKTGKRQLGRQKMLISSLLRCYTPHRILQDNKHHLNNCCNIHHDKNSFTFTISCFGDCRHSCIPLPMWIHINKNKGAINDFLAKIYPTLFSHNIVLWALDLFPLTKQFFFRQSAKGNCLCLKIKHQESFNFFKYMLQNFIFQVYSQIWRKNKYNSSIPCFSSISGHPVITLLTHLSMLWYHIEQRR